MAAKVEEGKGTLDGDKGPGAALEETRAHRVKTALGR
jgi:hypothetical protein